PTTEIGYVGEIVEVRTKVIRDLVRDGVTPVISPISLGTDGQHYNVNADEAAGAVAAALQAEQLLFLSDVPGVMRDGTVIKQLTPTGAAALIENGVVHLGMIPKVRAAVGAIENGVAQARIINLAGLSSGIGTTIGSDGKGSDAPDSSIDPDSVISAEAKYIVPTYSRPPHVFTRGEGAYLYTAEGKRYLDFSAGIAVTVLGHSDPEWAAAVIQQAGTLTHVSNLYHTTPHVDLARRLVEHSFADRVFFCNSGSEANEAALKFARKCARTTDSTGKKTGIVAFEGGFHGRTAGALAATARAEYREPFEPLLPGVTFARFNDLSHAAESINTNTCAVIVEPVQGEGGVRAANIAFLQGLRHICNQHQALLIFDEVQCGLARSGNLWAHQAAGVTPDIMTLAKPLAGGLPIGATLVTETIAQVLQPGDHGSTFAAGPLVCHAANVVFDRVAQPAFLESVRSKGQYILEGLQALDTESLLEVRGSGLLVGAEFSHPVKPLIAAAADRGLLTISAGENVLRLCPPLVVSMDEVNTAIDIIADCLTTLGPAASEQR
ncbi:MAG: acetylornithine/succinylornithine family transaminase, partial [Anaerolineales bacterium]|nr:acetylornithine/succinylornithine family transaminase [Anaerolineales bacterium]